jgi:hypothetical protein
VRSWRPLTGMAGNQRPALSNPLMQPTNAGVAGCRSRPPLPAATKDRRLSRVRLELISHSLGNIE